MPFKVDSAFVDFSLNFSNAERNAQRLNAQMAKMGRVAGVAADAQDRVERSTRKAGAAAKKAKKELSGQQKETKKLVTSAKHLLVTLLSFAVIRRVFVGLTRVLVKFETRMAEVSTIAGLAAGKMKRFSKEVLNLSRTVPQSADELGAGAYQIFSAGITDAADAMNVLNVASKAAVGGVTSTLVAVDAITTILNAYGLEAGQATRISDLLFQTVKGGKITFDQLSAGVGIVAKQASVMGVNFEEVAASIAAITQATGRPRAAFTELAGLFRSIIAEEEATTKAAAKLGIEWNLAGLRARGLAGLLADLNKATDGNATAIRKVVREDEGFRAAVVLSANGARGLRTQLDGMAGAAGAAETAFRTMAETTDNQAKIAINNFNASLLELRDLILPVVTAELKGLVGIMDLFRSVDLRRPAALATVQTLAANLENLTGEPRLRAISRLRKAMDDLMGGGGALGRPQHFLETLLEISDAELLALQQGFRAIADDAERFAFFNKQFVETNKEIQRRKLGVEEPAVKPPPELPPTKPGLRPEQVAARLKLEEELAERVREITLTTAQQQIDLVAKLREAYIKEFGAISAEAEANFQTIEAAAQEALSIEKARQLGTDFRAEIARALGQIEFEAVAITDEEERALFIQERQVELFEARVAEARALLAATENTTDEEEELTKVLAETLVLLRRATKEKVTQAELDEKAKRLAKERLRDFLTTLSLIKQSVDGALDFARAMGLVNAEMVDTIQALSQIGVGIAALIKGIGSSDPLAIVSGGLGVLGGLGGLFAGDSPEVKRREDLLRQNNIALERLRNEFSLTLKALGEFTGAEFGKAQDLLGRRTTTDLGGPFGSKLFRANITEAELAFLRDVAESLGLTLDVTEESFAQLEEAIRDFDLSRITESFIGAADMLQRRFAIFDKEFEKPIDRLNAWVDLLREFSGLDIPDFDLSTEAGRAALDQFIKDVFDSIEAGTFDERFGMLGLTIPEFLNLLAGIESVLDEIESEGVTGDEGLTENFVRSTRITEAQGNELLTLGRTSLVVEREQLKAQHEMVNLLGIMAGISPPPPSAAAAEPSAANIDVGGITVPVTVAVTEEVDAAALVERLGSDLAVVIDRRLSELQTREDRALGDTGRVA